MQGNKLMAAISYVWILFLVPLFAAKDDAFARYHANQGLVLFLVNIALYIISIIPFVGPILSGIGGIVNLVFMVLGIINAVKGETKPLPFIGGIQILK